MESVLAKKFALVVKGESVDGKSWAMDIVSKNEGMTFPEIIFYVEGWLTKVKAKVMEDQFKNMEFGNG